MYYYHDIDPVALDLGFWQIHWYGITYLAGFLLFLILGRLRARREDTPMKPYQVADFLFWAVLGVVVGGRMGYVLFYGWAQWAADPLFPIWINEGGMSFHGGLLGVILVMWFYSRHLGCGLLRLSDFAAPLVPLGLACGRIGNFIGGELWGRITDVPWAVIFPEAIQAGGRESVTLYTYYMAGDLDHLARHPSQLYQAAGEGLALFIILWVFSRQPRPAGAVSGLFLAGYAFFRFAVEFFREPDTHIGFIAFDWMTMGHLLSLPMFVAGVVLMIFAYRRNA